jgi:hypothetical protein
MCIVMFVIGRVTLTLAGQHVTPRHPAHERTTPRQYSAQVRLQLLASVACRVLDLNCASLVCVIFSFASQLDKMFVLQ